MGQKHVIELLDFYGWWLLERRSYCVVWASLNSLLFCLNLPVLEWQVCPTMSSVSELGWGSDHVLGLASHALSDEPMVSQETLALASTCWKRLEQISIVPSWPPEDRDYVVRSLQLYTSLWPRTSWKNDVWISILFFMEPRLRSHYPPIKNLGQAPALHLLHQ